MTDDSGYDGQQRRYGEDDDGDDGDENDPRRELRGPEGVEDLIEEVDALLTGDLQKHYKQKDGQ
jgi:hypothetical protein